MEPLEMGLKDSCRRLAAALHDSSFFPRGYRIPTSEAQKLGNPFTEKLAVIDLFLALWMN